MKRLLSTALALLMLLGALGPACAAAEDAPAWAEAYRAILVRTIEQCANSLSAGGLNPSCEYLVYDVDKDGTPELLIKIGTCEADYLGRLYTMGPNGPFQVGEDLGLGHSAFYSDPGENGIVLMYGHMGYAMALRIRIEDGYAEDLLYEDDLNERLQSDPEAEYVYPDAVIPGAAPLTLCRAVVGLPLTHYDEITRCLNGESQEAANAQYPKGDEDFFEALLRDNGTVYAVTADGFANSPGYLCVQDLLREDVAAMYMDGDAVLGERSCGDLNGDGQLECLVSLETGSRNHIYCVLSEQDGTVYAYLIDYMEDMRIESNGDLSIGHSWTEKRDRARLIFESGEAFLLWLS